MDPGFPQIADDGDQGRGAAVGGDGDLARVLVKGRGADPVASEDLGRRFDLGALVHDDLDPLTALLGLEGIGGAAGDDLPVVVAGDGVGQLVGLLQVLRREQERRPVPDETADDLPHPEPAARIEAGRRLIEEEQPRPADEGAAEVQPSPHAARIGLDHPVGGIVEVELL